MIGLIINKQKNLKFKVTVTFIFDNKHHERLKQKYKHAFSGSKQTALTIRYIMDADL